MSSNIKTRNILGYMYNINIFKTNRMQLNYCIVTFHLHVTVQVIVQ